MSQDNTLSRREIILQTLALMLETHPGQRITTAALAKQVGVSEAALYRHFPSKAKMFEALIEFAEQTLFSRINLITNEQSQALKSCENIMSLVLAFAAKNPGICRLLTGDALMGENDRLRKRVNQVFERLETELKQVIRQAEIKEGLVTQQSVTSIANLLTACVEGRIIQFVRSGFKLSPTEHWAEQWLFLSSHLLRSHKFSDFSEPEKN